jgi:hypothetical protein
MKAHLPHLNGAAWTFIAALAAALVVTASPPVPADSPEAQQSGIAAEAGKAPARLGSAAHCRSTKLRQGSGC